MALVVKDRVKVTTATTGTGTLTLGSAVAGFQAFSAVLSNADTTYYAIFESSTGAWEVGLGTYASPADTLARTTILESSNAGMAINLTAGDADVFITYPAEKSVYLDASGSVTSAAGQIDISDFNNDAGYSTTTGTVTSVAATAGTGISISGSPITTSGTLTITNTAPDQTVVLTEGANVTITGTYPNFTIASTDTNTTYSAGNGISLTGTTFSVAAGGGLTQDASGLSHTDTSSQASVNNSNGVVIQDVTLDTYGHVTGLASVDLDTRYYTEAEVNTRLTNGTVTKIANQWSNQTGNLTGYVNDGGGNLGFRFNATPGGTNTLVENGIAYRFDVSNDLPTGALTIFRGSTASATAGQTITWTNAFSISGSTNVLQGFGQTIWTAGNDGAGSGLDADTVDGIQGSSFLRSDTADSTASTISFTGNIEVGDQILHHGDTDTYLQFHAADQFRVVTGNVERFEINNSDVTVQSALKEKYVALSGTTPNIDVDAGGGFSLTTSGNTTFTFTAFTSALSCAFVLQLTAGGTHTITWPASVDWAGGTAPDAPASGETDILVFWSRDGGTTWYGIQSVDAAA